MIVTITLNPCIDKSTTVDKIVPDSKLRGSELVLEAGGGGINVSKALKELGCSSLAVFTAGGRNGDWLKEWMENAGINTKTIQLHGETRENFMVVESSSGKQYRFVLPGPEVSQEIVQQTIDTINGLPAPPTHIVISGSIPPGMNEDAVAVIAKALKPTNAKLIVDTSGEALRKALEVGVYLIKPNIGELAKLTGKEYLELDEVDDAALALINKGAAEIVVVSMGPSGAMAVGKSGVEQVPAPTVKKLSTVGAGDSMVAGITWMLSQGKTPGEALRMGVACGTAATMNSGTQLFKRADVEKLYQWILQAKPLQ
jgi:6-phosphofructokinase 2